MIYSFGFTKIILKLAVFKVFESEQKEKKIMTNKKEQRVVKGYDDIEKALRRAEDTGEGIWIGSEEMGRWVFAYVGRSILVNVGMARHEFHAFDKAINYITEFLFN